MIDQHLTLIYFNGKNLKFNLYTLYAPLSVTEDWIHKYINIYKYLNICYGYRVKQELLVVFKSCFN